MPKTKTKIGYRWVWIVETDSGTRRVYKNEDAAWAYAAKLMRRLPSAPRPRQGKTYAALQRLTEPRRPTSDYKDAFGLYCLLGADIRYPLRINMTKLILGPARGDATEWYSSSNRVKEHAWHDSVRWLESVMNDRRPADHFVIHVYGSRRNMSNPGGFHVTIREVK